MSKKNHTEEVICTKNEKQNDRKKKRQETEKTSKKRVIFLILLCFVAIAIFAIIHEQTRTKVPKNHIAIEVGDEIKYLDLDGLQTVFVSGQTINGKGETKEVSGQGILLRNILLENSIMDFTEVAVVAGDQYSAQVSYEEIMEEDQVYLLIENTEARLYVFKDSNSKRNVSDVEKIVVVR